jgi:hypothetical protein
LKRVLVDDDRNPLRIQLLPGLSDEEIERFSRSRATPISDDIRDLLQFCTGIDGTVESVDFTGQTFGDIGYEELLPHGLPIAHDGFGNYWIVDLRPGSADWGPIYFCSHDAPIMLLQAFTVQQFVTELFEMFSPSHKSLVDDVHEDRLFDVWRKNPGVIQKAEAWASNDPDIRSFAATLDDGFALVDLRNAPIGMGFSHGRYGPKTEVRRYGLKPIWAYRRPEKTGLLSKLLGHGLTRNHGSERRL